MKREKKGVEGVFRVAKDGSVLVPSSVLTRIDAAPGARLRIRITGEASARALARRGVTEAEVETICSLQLEPREHVEEFLLAEGSLTKDAGFRRSARKVLQ